MRCKVILIWLVGIITVMGQPVFDGSNVARIFYAAPPNAGYQGLGSFYNPAQLNYNHGFESEFYWGGKDGAAYHQFQSLGMALGRLGMGYQQIKSAGISVSEYRLSSALGDKNLGLGLGYIWNKGDIETDNQILLGLIWRPKSWLSISGAWERAVTGRNYTSDGGIAIRPWADNRLTLFGQYYYFSLSRHSWSAMAWGAEIKLYPGCHLAMTYFRARNLDTDLSPLLSDQLESNSPHSLHLSVKLDLRSFGFRSSSHYDQHDHYTYQTYGVRLGFPQEKLPVFRLLGKTRLMRLELNRPLGYRNHPLRREYSILGLQKLLRNLPSEKDIDGLYLKLGGFSADPSTVYEIRKELELYKSHHKKIYVYLENPDLMDYYLATVADTIMMDELGMMPTLGLIFSSTYYKGLLDKLGIGVEEWRYFKYKSAFDVLVRQDMSEGDREQKQKIIDDFYHIIQSSLTSSRGFKDSIMEVLFDQESIMTAQRAKEIGLIDRIARGDQYFADNPRYQIVSSPSPVTFQTVRDEWGEPSKIAVVYALGACDMVSGIEARRLEKILKSIGQNDEIKAVVLRIDSPGGDALASDLVAEQILSIKKDKPVIVSQGWLAASGGYWLSMYASKIVTTPFTLTGSIGVIGGWFYNRGLKEKTGLTTDGVRIGTHADLMQGMALPFLGVLPDRNLNDVEKKKIANLLMSSYQHFIRKVAQGRNMPEDNVKAIAQGRVWTGYTACQIGLADQIGSLYDAVETAATLAGIKNISRIQLLEYHKPGFTWNDLMGIGVLEERLQASPEFQYWSLRMKNNGKPLFLLDDWYEMR